MITTTCAYCLAHDPSGLTTHCSACNMVYYCSRKCMIEDSLIHSADFECPILQVIRERKTDSTTDEVRHVVRTLALRLSESRFPSRKRWRRGTRAKEYLDLVTNIHHFDRYTLESLGYYIAGYVYELCKWTGNVHFFDGYSDIMNIICRNRCNAFALRVTRCAGENTLSDCGTGVCVRTSLFNHSCAPNAHYYVHADAQKPPEIHLTSTADVPAGSELCITYIDSTLPMVHRRAKLKESYFFHCVCQRCKSDARVLALLRLG